MTHCELDRPGDYRVGHASACLRPSDLEPFRHAQGHLVTYSYDLAHQVRPDHPKTGKQSPSKEGISIGSPRGITNWLNHTQAAETTQKTILSSTGTPCYAQKTWKRLDILKTIQITQYIGLGLPSWLTPTPRYVAHVSYLTTHKAPPEMPCSTPFIQIRRPEWLVLTRGWGFQVFIQITQETKNPV